MFTIVIIAYNRHESLRRLLNSLSQSCPIETDINMIISLEGGSSEEVKNIANEYMWEYGNKTVVFQNEQLGLVKHFIWAGDQTYKYGNVLFLEEDAIVSPMIFKCLQQMIPFYENDQYVTSISLYNNLSNELTLRMFSQIEDGSDVFFFQHPYMGNLWFPKWWDEFKKWFSTYTPNTLGLPDKIVSWEKSFKRIYIQFLVERGLYVVYPRVSLVSDSADTGLHVTRRNNTRSNLLCEYSPLRLIRIDKSCAIYDAYGDIEPRCLKRLNPILENYDFVNDINGLKHLTKDDIVLTCRKVSKHIISFDGYYKPIEIGAALNLQGDGLYLCYASDIIESQSDYLNHCQEDDLKMYYPIRRRTILSLFRDFFVRKRF